MSVISIKVVVKGKIGDESAKGGSDKTTINRQHMSSISKWHMFVGQKKKTEKENEKLEYKARK